MSRLLLFVVVFTSLIIHLTVLATMICDSSTGFDSCCPSTNDEFFIEYNALHILHHAYYGCTNLTSVVLPCSVSSIYYSAFAECTNLAYVEIPNSVNVIEYEAFRGCVSLTSVIIPSSVRELMDQAFYNCTSLTSVTMSNYLAGTLEKRSDDDAEYGVFYRTPLADVKFAYCPTYRNDTLVTYTSDGSVTPVGPLP